MRLFLDAHISGPRIAGALRERGHDVHAADEDRSLEGWGDENLLALATQERRIMVTFDVKDFPGIVQRWAEAQRSHAGCMIFIGTDDNEFGLILDVIEARLNGRPGQAAWRGYCVFVGRGR